MALLVQFLSQVRSQVRSASGDQLRAWLQIEPSAPQSYHNLAAELRTQFRHDTSTSSSSLDATIKRCLPEDDDVPRGGSTPWPGFVAFMREYLLFWRDVNPDDLMDTHQRLSGLVSTCSTAFAHPMHGSLLLQTSMSLSESLFRLTMILSKRPDLTTSRKRRRNDDENRKSVAETSAEIIQKIFTTCLTDRSSGRGSKPEGKKVGVYMFANLVLKLLFACGKTHLAQQIFTNISSNSSPLALYPASQRVTFLYYLGRFHFSNSHLIWAARCLEDAYVQTPRAFFSHRTRILTYLIPVNMLLGKLPSAELLSRPEAAQALAPVYAPIAHSLKTGNFVLFQHTLAAHQAWLLDRALLLVLTYRLRPLLWRALARKTFILTYVPNGDATSRKAATLELGHLLTVATYLQSRLEGSSPNGPKKLLSNQGLLSGNLKATASDIEGTVASLIQQGFMHGFIAHSQQRFAIMGAKQNGPLLAGWPKVWTAIKKRRYDEHVDWDTIPGWVKGQRSPSP